MPKAYAAWPARRADPAADQPRQRIVRPLQDAVEGPRQPAVQRLLDPPQKPRLDVSIMRHGEASSLCPLRLQQLHGLRGRLADGVVELLVHRSEAPAALSLQRVLGGRVAKQRQVLGREKRGQGSDREIPV